MDTRFFDITPGDAYMLCSDGLHGHVEDPEIPGIVKLGPDATVPDSSVSFELVWVAPLSPCHGVVQSATFREAPIDYGDVVLWDGAPVSVLKTPEGPVPRFPLLEILRRGDEERMRFVALSEEPGRLAEVEAALPPGWTRAAHPAGPSRSSRAPRSRCPGCPRCGRGWPCSRR